MDGLQNLFQANGTIGELQVIQYSDTLLLEKAGSGSQYAK